ncbi:MAG: diaminopimelate epimerase [Sandaracinaceae bacterium]|nr:diaminopimelate epimerase [Sandaracinaceae bacterium]
MTPPTPRWRARCATGTSVWAPTACCSWTRRRRPCTWSTPTAASPRCAATACAAWRCTMRAASLLRRALCCCASPPGRARTTATSSARPVRTGKAWVTVEMAVPSLDPHHVPAAQVEPLIDTPIAVGEHTLRLTGVSMGNPHAVTFDVLPEPVRIRQVTLGPAVQALPLFPRGVNVGFASAVGVDEAGVATRFTLDVYERGAGWTLACGTGACAAGVAAVVTGRAPRHTPLRFDLPGGPLEITVGEPGERVRMRGPARFVFEGLPSPRLLGASA